MTKSICPQNYHLKLYLEVVGIHVQLLRVQHAQFSVRVLDVVHVLHGAVQAVQDLHSVSRNVWIHLDGLGIVEVTKSTKVPLGPGIHDQTPTQKERVSSLAEDEGLQIKRKNISKFLEGSAHFPPNMNKKCFQMLPCMFIIK
uniref:Uncharacterized protein n=1 Tax=Gouania willdenowi TaxID=441366 RepID=A0A8C5GGA8_GOUWI